jgi:hypothetical protein
MQMRVAGRAEPRSQTRSHFGNAGSACLCLARRLSRLVCDSQLSYFGACWTQPCARRLAAMGAICSNGRQVTPAANPPAEDDSGGDGGRSASQGRRSMITTRPPTIPRPHPAASVPSTPQAARSEAGVDPKQTTPVGSSKHSSFQYARVEDTPQGQDAQRFAFECPLCFFYCERTLVTSCCKNYICHQCAKEWWAGKAPTALASRCLPRGRIEAPIACPNCNSDDGFVLADVDPKARIRRYVDSPATKAALARAAGTGFTPVTLTATATPDSAAQRRPIVTLTHPELPETDSPTNLGAVTSGRGSEVRMRAVSTGSSSAQLEPDGTGSNSSSPEGSVEAVPPAAEQAPVREAQDTPIAVPGVTSPDRGGSPQGEAAPLTSAAAAEADDEVSAAARLHSHPIRLLSMGPDDLVTSEDEEEDAALSGASGSDGPGPGRGGADGVAAGRTRRSTHLTSGRAAAAADHGEQSSSGWVLSVHT